MTRINIQERHCRRRVEKGEKGQLESRILVSYTVALISYTGTYVLSSVKWRQQSPAIKVANKIKCEIIKITETAQSDLQHL